MARAVPGGGAGLPQVKRLLSSEHFSVDGTLIEAWASMKSFRPKDGSGEPPEPRAQRRAQLPRREALERDPASTTDPDARLYRKGDGQSSRLCFMGHALMENRNGLVVDAMLTHATGTAEREAALTCSTAASGGTGSPGGRQGLRRDGLRRRARARKVTPHIAVNGAISKTGKRRKTAIDRRTTRHPAMRSASGSASASRRPSAGSRRRRDITR